MNRLLPLVCLTASLLVAAPPQPASPKAPGKSVAPVDPERKPTKRYRLPERELVNINGASKSELMARLGLTADMAEKVIKGRPYLSKTELVTKKVMTQAQWQTLRHNIMAKQPNTPILAKP